MYFKHFLRQFIHGKFLRLIVLDLHRIVGRGGMSGMGGKGGSHERRRREHITEKVNLLKRFEIFEWKFLFFKTLLLFK
jgi:hypothetical protein